MIFTNVDLRRDLPFYLDVDVECSRMASLAVWLASAPLFFLDLATLGKRKALRGYDACAFPPACDTTPGAFKYVPLSLPTVNQILPRWLLGPRYMLRHPTSLPVLQVKMNQIRE